MNPRPLSRDVTANARLTRGDEKPQWSLPRQVPVQCHLDARARDDRRVHPIQCHLHGRAEHRNGPGHGWHTRHRNFDQVLIAEAGGGNDSAAYGVESKRAVTDRLASIASTQAAVPVQSPLHPANRDPGIGDA